MPKKKVKTFVPSEKPTTLRDKVYGTMLIIVVAIMPVVVRHTHVAASPELYDILPQAFHNDFFAHYKGWILGIAALVMAFYAIADWAVGGITKERFLALIKTPPIAAACVFLLMATMSAIFSSYNHTSWNGAVDRNEGLFILFSYFIVFFAAMHYVRANKHAKIIMYGLVFSSIIMGVIGLGQFVGRDFYATRLAALLVMGSWDATLNRAFDIAHATLYNPNTFGKYAAMTAPILLACAMVYDGRKWLRAVFLVGGLLMLIGVMGSGSMGGLIGITAAIMVTVITFVCRFFYQMRLRNKIEAEGDTPKGRNTVTWVISGGILAALLVGLFFIPTVNERLHFLLGRVEQAARRDVAPTYDYILDGERFTVLWQGQEKFSLVMLSEASGPDDTLWRIYDATGQPIPLVSRTTPETAAGEEPLPTTFVYDIPGHRRLSLQAQDGLSLVHGLAIFLHDGRIHAVAPNRTIVDLEVPVPSIGFEGIETWGSSRGHIWSRTFPLMPARTIIGSGPDTFTLVFPQHDFIGKMRFHPHPYLLIDKAHNLYMQAWVTTGGISALALIFLFGHYLITSFMAVVRSRMKEGAFIFGLRFGLLAGISAFCMSAMATDSTIGSSGVFYLLLGLGYGVGWMAEKDRG